MEDELKHWGLKIITRDKYILVEPSKGVDFLEVSLGLAKLLSIPEIVDKHDIWVFREGKMDIAYTDLYKINEYIKNNSPQCSKKKKTAIVVETGLQRSLAELYINMEAELRHEIRVFSDFESAEEWIVEH
jgi:hypothetical protein